MSRYWIILLAGLAPLDALPEKAKEPLTPYVVRVLALGHEPDRKYKAIEGGLFVMVPPAPDEIPPSPIYVTPPRPPAPLPANSPLARQFGRVPCELSINGIQQVTLPNEIPRDARLLIEREVIPSGSGSNIGKQEKLFAELGVIERKPDSSSSLVILYNPAGSNSWNNVRANVIDTSDSALPASSILVYNVCRETLSATIGTPGIGILGPGQSAIVRPQVDAEGNFRLRLFLDRNGELVQLIDGERGFPPGSRAFLVIYPLPPNRNARNADFVLFVIPPDPKPEPVAAPAPGPAKAGAAAAR